jgi:hypothetical protein
MKGGQTPIHIQRFAPADLHADEHFRLLESRRAYMIAHFYRQFIDYSFMAGGDLPADAEGLAAAVRMPRRDVENALAFCLNKLVFKDGDRLYQRRVRREVKKELQFRSKQRKLGAQGGRPKKEATQKGKPKGSLLEPESPPSPPSAPAPPSTPAPPSVPPTAAGRTDAEDDARRYGNPGEAEEVRAQIRVAKAEASRVTGRPEGELVAEASRTPNRNSFHDEADCPSVPWLRKTLEKLITIRFQAQADQRDRPTPPPTDRAAAREDAALAGMQGGKTPTTSRILEGLRRDRPRLGRGLQPPGGEPQGHGQDAGDEGAARGDVPSGDGSPDR